MNLEATHLRGNRYAVRPAGALGTCGWIDGKTWQVAYVSAKNAADAVRKARQCTPRSVTWSFPTCGASSQWRTRSVMP